MSSLVKNLYLKFMEHPAMVFSKILKSLRWERGNVYENHQNTHVYIFPARIFQEIRLEVRAILGSKVARPVLYNFNQMSAEAIVRDGREMGFEGTKLIRYFLAVLALFGWGFVEEFEFDPDTSRGQVRVQNFPKSGEVQPEPVHDDFRGIFARVLELVHHGQYQLIETACCEMEGTAACIYEVSMGVDPEALLQSPVTLQPETSVDAKSIPKNKAFKSFLKQFSMPENGVLVFASPGMPGVDRVVIKDVASINSMFLQTADLLGWKTVGPIVFRVARNFVLNTLPAARAFSREALEAYLQHLTWFGWGEFTLQQGGAGTSAEGVECVVTLENAPFTRGFPARTRVPTDYLVRGLLSGLFERHLGARVRVTETACVAMGAPRCEFAVTPMPGC